MSGVIRRGRVSTVAPVVVSVDESVVEAALAPHVADTGNPHVTTAAQVGAAAALRELAVVSSHVGVTRAFLSDPWHWEPRLLGRVLLLASLRG